MPLFLDLTFSIVLLSYFALQHFKFTLAAWSRNFKGGKALRIMIQFCSPTRSFRRPSKIFICAKAAFLSLFSVFHINLPLFSLFFMPVPFCSSLFKYITVINAFKLLCGVPSFPFHLYLFIPTVHRESSMPSTGYQSLPDITHIYPTLFGISIHII